MKINMGRVVITGLMAGLVMNLADLGMNVWILGSIWRELLSARSVTLSAPTLLLLGTSSFVFGVVGVWVYAGIAPRYGARPLTAFRVGAGVWAVAYVVPVLSLVAVEGAWWPALALAAWGLVKIALGVSLGAWWFNEFEVGLRELGVARAASS